jgi:hypothetical protein
MPPRRFTWRVFLAALTALAALLAVTPARADPPPPAADGAAAYEQHMANGRKLLEDESWAAARTEFEAAYAAAPRGAPLLQIAACERAAQRWPQAIAAVTRALGDHAGTLDDAEKKAAEQSLAEMRAQIGTVQVVVAPAGATLRIDGEDQPPGGAARSIVLGPGPHRLEARLEGWAPAAQTITIAGGDTVAVKLGLAPDRGRVTVRAPDAATAISIDESQVGEGTWSGWLTPGAHVVHVYTPGGASWSMQVDVVAGKAVEVSPAEEGVRGAPPSAASRVKRGPYAMLVFTTFVPLPPSDFSGTAVGVSAGARLGYRFASIAGAELAFEYAHAGASGQATPSGGSDVTGTPAPVPMSYALSSFRVGLHLRLMTTGQRVRFVQTFGAGPMVDTIKWTPGTGAQAMTRQGASGVDGFGVSETGVEIDFSGLLLGLTLQQVLGSGGALASAQPAKFATDTYGGPQYTLGIGLRGGYRLW